MDIPKNLAQSTITLGGLQQMVAKLGRLCEISVTLNSTLDLEPLLQFILENATAVLECEAASIMLYNEKRGELVFAATQDKDMAKFQNIVIPLEGSIAGAIFKNGTPVCINDVSEDPRHFDQVGEQLNFQPKSLVGVPMKVREKTVGVLEALNKTQGRFSDKDTHLLSIIASQAAVAIHNARMHQALQKAYDELSRVDKIKSNFMAVASHELRTPLGIILGYGTFLQEDASGESAAYAEKIINAAMHLRTLVEDMTNMNMMHIGSLGLFPTPVPVQQVLRDALEEVRAALKAKEHHLIIDVPQPPIIIQGEPAKLVLVFVNILNNAIRFTPKMGKITLRCQSTEKQVRIQIQDNGMGIPKAELDKIFQEFYQVEDHLVRRFGGLGLGLAIAKGLVNLHNGKIWAESPGPGKGATITVLLPKKKA